MSEPLLLQGSPDPDDIISKIASHLHPFLNTPLIDFTLPVSTTRDQPSIDLSSVIKPLDMNECHVLSKNADGSRKKLDQSQFDEIRTDGHFSVASQTFPGQSHRWYVSNILQKGINPTKESFYEDMSVAYHFIVIYFLKLLYRGKYFTITNSIKHFFKSLVELPILLFGWRTKYLKYDKQH